MYIFTYLHTKKAIHLKIISFVCVIIYFILFSFGGNCVRDVYTGDE